MADKEFFHTLEEYQQRGLEPFLEHAKAYLQGSRTVPVSRMNSVDGSPAATFTFCSALLRELLGGDEKLEKGYEVAIKYGLRGHTDGGRNGVFLLGSNESMVEATERLMREHEGNVLADLDIRKEGLDALQKVKIVSHDPSGRRIVGVYEETRQRIIFLGIGQYD